MLVVLGFIIFIIILVCYIYGKLQEDLVHVNGFNYNVTKIDGKYKAKVLHRMNETAIKFISLMRKKIQLHDDGADVIDDEDYERFQKIYKRLRKRYNVDQLGEAFSSIIDPDRTSFTINKGEEVRMCLKMEEIEDERPIYFLVLMHELAHVGSKGAGHGKEFWDNYDLMMKTAVMEGWTNDMKLPDDSVMYCDKIKIGMGEIKRLRPETYMDRPEEQI